MARHAARISLSSRRERPDRGFDSIVFVLKSPVDACRQQAQEFYIVVIVTTSHKTQSFGLAFTVLFSVLTVSIVCWCQTVSSFQKSLDPGQMPSGPACSSTADDGAIYSAVIRRTLLDVQAVYDTRANSGTKHGKSRVVLSTQTQGYPPGMGTSTTFGVEARQKLLGSASAETKSDFDARAKLHCDVTKSIEPQGTIVFVTANDVEVLAANDSGGWDAFHKKYPNSFGLTFVSAIGFNTPHDQALVYLGNQCGISCGSGYFVLLRKKRGKWEVWNMASIWASPLN
jgi:hypothetical protein